MHYCGWGTLVIIAASCTLGIANAQDAAKGVIASPTAPAAIGPYSQAISVGRTVYLSGQIAIDPKTKQMIANASIEEQTKRVLENLRAVLTADGMTLNAVVSTTVFMTDLNDFGKMNQVYGTFFTDAPPARATVQVARLPKDAIIEISAIAVHR